MSNPLARARYLLAAHTPRQLPPDGGFEVAFAGRSNAGKSSALNALCQQNALARVSKTPGRTQQLVFFDSPVRNAGPTLPGRPARLRLRQGAAGPAGALAGLPRRYFRTREALKGLVVVMDIRHPLKEYDRQMLGYAVRARPARARAADQGRQARPRRSRATRCRRCARSCSAPFGDTVSVQTFSGESKQGVDEARAVVGRWLEL